MKVWKRWRWDILHLHIHFWVHYWKSKSRLLFISLILASPLCMVFMISHCCASNHTTSRRWRLTISELDFPITVSLLLPLFGLCHTWITISRIQVDRSVWWVWVCLDFLLAKEGPIWEEFSKFSVFCWPVLGFETPPFLGIHLKKIKSKKTKFRCCKEKNLSLVEMNKKNQHL